MPPCAFGSEPCPVPSRPAPEPSPIIPLPGPTPVPIPPPPPLPPRPVFDLPLGDMARAPRRSNSAVQLANLVGWRELRRCRPHSLPHCLAEPPTTPNPADRLRPFLCCLFRCPRAPCHRPSQAEAVPRRRSRGAWLSWVPSFVPSSARNYDQNR